MNKSYYISKKKLNITRNRNIIMISTFGESNSGGYGLNTDATELELSPRECVQIWDNINNDGFEILDVGTNNLLGHAGLIAVRFLRHGWELELANRVAQKTFINDIVYLTKCGQGGSVIAQWATGQDYWNTLVTRINGSIDTLAAQEKTIYHYGFWSMGINDGQDGTSAQDFYDGCYDFLLRIKELMPNIIVIGCHHPYYYQSEFTELANNLSWYKNINPPVPVDNVHWNYSQIKANADAMINITSQYFNNK